VFALSGLGGENDVLRVKRGRWNEKGMRNIGLGHNFQPQHVVSLCIVLVP